MNETHKGFMRKGFLLAGAALALAVFGSPVQAETWCLRDFGRDNPVCAFGSAGQCTSAAVIMGGICEREALGRAATARPCPPSREAKAVKGRRVSGADACDAS